MPLVYVCRAAGRSRCRRRRRYQPLSRAVRTAERYAVAMLYVDIDDAGASAKQIRCYAGRSLPLRRQLIANTGFSAATALICRMPRRQRACAPPVFVMRDAAGAVSLWLHAEIPSKESAWLHARQFDAYA